MTPERLAEIERRARGTSFDAYYQRTILDLIAHIRDLEAQLAAAREKPSIDDCLYHRCVEHWTVPKRNDTASTDGAECGGCIERDWRSAFENYATHHNWCASGHGGMHVLGSPGACDCGRDARLATATQPSDVAGFGDLIGSTPSLPWPRWDATPPSPEVGE
jgi:hypothetical protein